MRAEQVHVEDTPQGNLRIIVPDQESDSLVVLNVSRRHGTLSVEVGMRGNLDADRRPKPSGLVPARRIKPTDLGRIVDRAVEHVKSWPLEYQRSGSANRDDARAGRPERSARRAERAWGGQ